MAYIDPGTGSMLFTILIGILSAGIHKSKDIRLKAKFLLSAGRTQAGEEKNMNFVVFSDHKRYWNVFEPVCDEFEKRGMEIVYLTCSEDDPALLKQYEHVKCEYIGEGNKAFAKLNRLKADIVLSTTPSLDVFNWKRSRDVKYYVHIPHAASDLTLYRMFGIDFYDAILTSGEYHEDQIRGLERKRNLPGKEIVMTGITYLDAMKTRLDTVGLCNNQTPIVLLAPSWGENAILSKFGGAIIEELLKTDYKIIIRPHPQSFTSEKELIDSLMAKYPDSDRLEWNRDNDNFEVLRKTDVMISDFSGVLFDFSLVFDKPFIYTEVDFDYAPYDACWLDEQPWTFKVLPKMGLKITEENLSEIGCLIKQCICDTKLEMGRKEAREETWCYIGESAERTTDYLINKYEQLQVPNDLEG